MEFLDGRIGVEDTLKRLRFLSYFGLSRYEDFIEKLEYYESYIGEDGVTRRLKRSMGVFFAGISLTDLKGVVKFIEGYIGKEGVKDRMKSDLQSFSVIKLSRLEELEKEWGEKKLKEALNKYNFRITKNKTIFTQNNNCC